MGGFSVCSGISDPILFLLEFLKVTGNSSWREETCLVTDYFSTNFDEGRKMQTDVRVSGSEVGPISEAVGLSFVFTELRKTMKRQKYLDFTVAETEKIAALAKRVGEDVGWLDEPGGVSYDAGIALYLLCRAKVFEQKDWRALAALAAKRLLEQAVETEGGAYK